jgi:hypothetical protein
MMLETIFRQVTGNRVKGLLGMLWTYTFLLYTGAVLTESWQVGRAFQDLADG